MFSSVFVLLSAAAAIVRKSRNRESKNKDTDRDSKNRDKDKGTGDIGDTDIGDIGAGDTDTGDIGAGLGRIQRTEQYLVPSAVAINAYMSVCVINACIHYTMDVHVCTHQLTRTNP